MPEVDLSMPSTFAVERIIGIENEHTGGPWMVFCGAHEGHGRAFGPIYQWDLVELEANGCTNAHLIGPVPSANSWKRAPERPRIFELFTPQEYLLFYAYHEAVYASLKSRGLA